MIDNFDLHWLRRISPGYIERVERAIISKHRYKREGRGSHTKIDIKKNLRICKCGRKIKGNTRYCTKCSRKDFLELRGRLAERPAMPDPYISWRYVI